MFILSGGLCVNNVYTSSRGFPCLSGSSPLRGLLGHSKLDTTALYARVGTKLNRSAIAP